MRVHARLYATLHEDDKPAIGAPDVVIGVLASGHARPGAALEIIDPEIRAGPFAYQVGETLAVRG